MPTFATPEPIFAAVELGSGQLRIRASDRTDTVVEVRPSDPDSVADVRAAEQTLVRYANGRLTIKARGRSFLLRSPSVVVTVDLPTGSRVEASAADAAELSTEGRLGDTKVRAGNGDIRLDETGRLRALTANGAITVRRCGGRADVSTANGAIRIDAIDGAATVKSANGAISLGDVAGDLRLSTAHGDITVDRAGASVVAKTAMGDVRIGEAVRGTIVLKTGTGEVEVGIREGTAAWLDVQSHHGEVRTSLHAADGPAASDETVEVRARTASGDIVIRRSSTD